MNYDTISKMSRKGEKLGRVTRFIIKKRYMKLGIILGVLIIGTFSFLIFFGRALFKGNQRYPINY